MKDDKTINRIRKLLELASNNPSESEARQAALKAQRLMVDNDIDEDDLGAPAADGGIATVRSKRTWRRNAMHLLAMTIADNFRCRFYYLYDVDGGRRSAANYMCFVGALDDARAAAMTFDYLAMAMDSLAKRAARERRRIRGSAKGAWDSYACGFIEGLSDAFDAQARGLMPAAPRAAGELLDNDDELMPRRFSIKVDDDGTFDDGRESGRHALDSHTLAGSMPLSA